MSWIQSDLEDIEHHLVPTTGRTVFRSLRSSLHSIRARLEGFVGPSDDNDPPAVDDEAQQHQQLLVGEEEGQSHNEVPSSSCVGRLMERLRIAELALSECIPLDRLYNELARRQEVAASNGPLSTPNRMIAADSQSQVQTATMYDRLLEDPAAADTDLPVTPRRRSSALLASRHKMERAENSAQDLTLHGSSSSSISTMRRKSSLILEQEDDDGVMEIEPEEATQRNNRRIDDDETAAVAGTPTILLTAKSRSNLDLARQSVLFPDSIQLDNHLESVDDPQQQQQYVEKPSTVVFSWGRQGSHSLCDHSNPVDFCDARVPAESPVGRAEIVSVSVGEHHTACVTASGQVLIVGENTSGEVDPDRMHVKGFARPFFLESLNQARIVQVSCGFNHTAALRSNGVVLAWGSNEFGQLGHQDHGGIAENAAAAAAAALFCRPAAMVLGPGNRATAVSCGDGFTLCLTSRMNVLACGVEGISGQSSHGPPRPLPALKYLPLVGIVAGRHHAVALTAHGSAFVWGDNAHGECCREYPKHLYVPMPMKPPTGMETHLSGAQLPPPLAHWVNQRPNGNSEQNSVSVSDEVAFVSAACGPDNTILVTKSGSLLVCGSNKQGQLGLNPLDHEFIYHPKLIRHPNASRCFVRAEIGDFHTILLDDWGDVWQLDGTKIVACSPLIMAKGVRCIAAGGEQSVAVMLRPGRQTPTREFSDAMMEQEEVQLAECVEDLIRSIPSDKVLIDNDEYRFDPDLVKISNQAEELFRTPSVLNSLFMDPAELDDLFTKLLNIQPSVRRQTIVSAIERGMRTGLDTFCIDDSRLMWPEQVRFLWLYIQCPMFVDWKQEGSVFDRRGDLILSLCESILGVPYEGYVALMAWATSVYTNDQFVKLLIRPLLSQLKKGLSVEAGAERRSIPVVVAVLRWLNSAAERVGNGVSPETFYSDAISNMHPFTLYNDLDRYKKASKQQRAADFFFCGNSFLISPSVKRNLLQMENEMNMMKVATENGLTFNVQDHTFVFDAFYVLEIDREQILKHTFEKISKAEPSDLRKKLRVVFKGEEGVDGKYGSISTVRMREKYG